MKKNILICLLFFAGFWVLFLALQNEVVYYYSLAKVSKNYVAHKDGMKSTVKKPYEKITDENTLRWDGEHYYLIKEKGYSADEDWRFAFFPLFSYIWKSSTLSPSKVIFLNFIMFAGGLLLLAYLFKRKWRDILLILSLPMAVVFLIPYTEATFFLMFAIAVWGYMKDKYWIYFIAMILASMSRNTILLVLPAILCAEILFFIKERNVRQSLFRLCMGSLPVLIGTGLVSLIQYSYGSKSIFGFFEAQRYWRDGFSWPNLRDLRDWSDESFAINIPTLIMIGISLITYVVAIALKQLNLFKKNVFLSFSSGNKSDYLNLIVLFCCLSALFSVFFSQGGNLHGLSRYVLCSPYFVILLFVNQEKLRSISLKKRMFPFIALVIFSLLVLLFLRGTGFYCLGYFIFVGTMALYLFSGKIKSLTYNAFLIGIFLMNILWTTFLYNMYLCNGWIYT